MLRPWGYIKIGSIEIPYLHTVEINHSMLSFVDTAVLTIPNTISKFDEKITDYFKVGDTVQISLGYYPEISIRFEGYISKITPSKVATIECEDESYIAKRTIVKDKVLLKDTTISALLDAIAPDIQKDVIADTKIGDWKIMKNANVADVLDQLKQTFSIYSYYREKRLQILSQAKTADKMVDVISIDFNKNVPNGENDLKLERPDTDNMVIKGVSKKKNGTATEVYAYYEDGKIVTGTKEPSGVVVGEINLGENDVISEQTLKTACENKLEAISFEGLSGTVTTYGYPYVEHGNEVNIKDLENPDVDGVYKVVGVQTKFSESEGLRQVISVGIRILDTNTTPQLTL